MKEAELLAALETARWILRNAPSWVDTLRKNGELTPEGEAAYQAHQKEVFEKPEAQPRDVRDPL